MFERFTNRACKVMALANEEAQRFNHEYLGTEHVLLGLIKEGSGVASNVLKQMGITLKDARNKIKGGPDMVTMGRLPQTPRAKKVLEYAIEESRNLNHNYIGTEHLLLGLLREPEGKGYEILIELGFVPDAIRAEVLRLLGSVDVEGIEEAHKLCDSLQRELLYVICDLPTTKSDAADSVHNFLDEKFSDLSIMQMKVDADCPKILICAIAKHKPGQASFNKCTEMADAFLAGVEG